MRMAGEFEIEETVKKIRLIFFERIPVDVLDDDDPLRYSFCLEKNGVRGRGMMEHREEDGDIERIIVEGHFFPVINERFHAVDKAQIFCVERRDIKISIPEGFRDIACSRPDIEDAVSPVEIRQNPLHHVLSSRVRDPGDMLSEKAVFLEELDDGHNYRAYD